MPEQALHSDAMAPARRRRMQVAEPFAPRLRQVLEQLDARLGGEPDCGHPMYLAHMRKPPHAVARAAYARALHRQLNNHPYDGAGASATMELECVRQLGALFGWQRPAGHLCGGGTLANLEAAWLAREALRGQGGQAHDVVLAGSTHAHYCHARHARLLGMRWEPVAADWRGRMLPQALQRVLERGTPTCVVASVGTPALGAVDPLPEIAALCERHGARLHADCAYGGYHVLAGNLDPDTRAAFEALGRADSIVVDPHKHGLQPYGCGCVLLRDDLSGHATASSTPVPAAATASAAGPPAHDPDYVYDDVAGPHLGRIALEGSRPGASAVALWATLRLLPLLRGGEFAAALERSREAALALWQALRDDPDWVVLAPPQLDVLAWGVRAAGVAEASRLARAVQHAARERGLHLSLTRLPGEAAVARAGMAWDGTQWLGLRACVMKPGQLDWVERIHGALRAAVRAATC